jgi:hypothetical protein
MPDGLVSGQFFENFFLKDIRDEPHAFVIVKMSVVERADTGAFLAAVLEGMKTEISDFSGFRMTIDAKDPALVVRLIVF